MKFRQFDDFFFPGSTFYSAVHQCRACCDFCSTVWKSCSKSEEAECLCSVLATRVLRVNVTELCNHSEVQFNGPSWTCGVSKADQCLALHHSSRIVRYLTALPVYLPCYATSCCCDSLTLARLLHWILRLLLFFYMFFYIIHGYSAKTTGHEVPYSWRHRLYLDSSLAAKWEMMQIICYLSSSDLRAWIHILCRILMQILLLVH